MNKRNYLIIAISTFFFHVVFAHTASCNHTPHHAETASACAIVEKTPVAPLQQDEPLELILPGDQTTGPTSSVSDAPAKAQPSPEDTIETPVQTEQPHALVSDEEILIDTIKYVIGTENKISIITLSQTKLPALDGSARTEKELIDEIILYEETQRTQPVSDEDEIDKTVKNIQKEHNISLDQLKEIFRSAGYTYEEGRAQISIMTAIGRLVNFIRYQVETMTIPDEEIKQFYNQNPVMQPAFYYIERAFIPFSPDSTIDELRTTISLFSPRELSRLEWTKPFKITKDDLADEKKSITDLKIGGISEPYQLENGFELFKMKTKQEKAAVPLEQRKNEITALLRKQHYEKKMNELITRLRNEASIITL